MQITWHPGLLLLTIESFKPPLGRTKLTIFIVESDNLDIQVLKKGEKICTLNDKRLNAVGKAMNCGRW